MKTTSQIASEIMSRLPAHIKGEIVTWPAAIDEAVYTCMKEYAKAVIDKILTRGDMIYCTDIDGNECGDRVEALYSYSKFQELKDNLK